MEELMKTAYDNIHKLSNIAYLSLIS